MDFNYVVKIQSIWPIISFLKYIILVNIYFLALVLFYYWLPAALILFLMGMTFNIFDMPLGSNLCHWLGLIIIIVGMIISIIQIII